MVIDYSAIQDSYSAGNNDWMEMPEFTLEPSLYTFGIALSNGEYRPIILELTEKMSNSVTQSEYLGVSIFPVPIEENRFTVSLTAYLSMNFKYSVLDHNGVAIYKESFKLKQGQEWKHVVKTEAPIPSGTVLHRFEFEDGSVKIVNTIRN